jgi:hypothetical protein
MIAAPCCHVYCTAAAVLGSTAVLLSLAPSTRLETIPFTCLQLCALYYIVEHKKGRQRSITCPRRPAGCGDLALVTPAGADLQRSDHTDAETDSKQLLHKSRRIHFDTRDAQYLEAPSKTDTMKPAVLVLCLLCLAAAGANTRAFQHGRRLAKL